MRHTWYAYEILCVLSEKCLLRHRHQIVRVRNGHWALRGALSARGRFPLEAGSAHRTRPCAWRARRCRPGTHRIAVAMATPAFGDVGNVQRPSRYPASLRRPCPPLSEARAVPAGPAPSHSVRRLTWVAFLGVRVYQRRGRTASAAAAAVALTLCAPHGAGHNAVGLLLLQWGVKSVHELGGRHPTGGLARRRCPA